MTKPETDAASWMARRMSAEIALSPEERRIAAFQELQRARRHAKCLAYNIRGSAAYLESLVRERARAGAMTGRPVTFPTAELEAVVATLEAATTAMEAES